MNSRSLPVIDRINVLGVRAHALNIASARRSIQSALRHRIKGYVCFLAVHGVMEAQASSELLDVYNRALLIAPDGMPVVWVGRAQGQPSMQRVTGPEFMLEIMGSPDFRDCSHFLCGGEPGMAEELRDNLRERFPAVNICGTFTPPFRPMRTDEEREFIEAVHRAAPDIVWVGLGAPKQELFMARYLPLLDTTLMMGVGAAFLMHTGRIHNSPRWVCNAGLQWAHRLLQEPTRLWRRYLLRNPDFICRILWQFVRHGRSTAIVPPAAMHARADFESMPPIG